jgi:D-alanine--poly(phosphoribitol) ligase subunit 1
MQINVLEYLEKGALATSRNETALIDGDRSLTFGELEIYAKRCASLIIGRHDAINQPIAVYLPKCTNTVVADLGIIYSGNIYSNLDVKSPLQRVKNILDNIMPVLVITSRELAQTVISSGVDAQQILLVEDIFKAEGQYDSEYILGRLDTVIDTDPLCIINTSGSTGLPKGVVMHHRSVIDFMDWVMDRLRLDGNEVIGSLSPFYFDIYTLELYLCLAKGATLVIIPEQLSSFPPRLVEFLAAKRINFIFWVPTIMVNISNLDLLHKVDLSCLKKVLFAGEVFPTKHLNYWRRHLPDTMFVNLYGPIEITVDCTYFIVDRELRDDEPVPIGSPCRNTDILILNENNALARVGEPGELCVRGSSLALGYWNDADKTSRAFVQNPLNRHYPELIYRTGDLVSRNERGEIMFIGRSDYQIKHMGYRIELGEIEHAVLGLNAVKNACVVYNKEKKEITLFFEADEPLSPASIRQYLSLLLPKYMLPTAFHQTDTLPRNPNGKIDRQKLSLAVMEKAV